MIINAGKEKKKTEKKKKKKKKEGKKWTAISFLLSGWGRAINFSKMMKNSLCSRYNVNTEGRPHSIIIILLLR